MTRREAWEEREADAEGRAPVATPAPPVRGPEAAVLALQRSAGNAATARILARESGDFGGTRDQELAGAENAEGITGFVGKMTASVKRYFGAIKKLFSREPDKAPENMGEVAEDSTRAAGIVVDIATAGKAVFSAKAQALRTGGGSPEQVAHLQELAESCGKGAELVETGASVFEKGVQIAEALEKLMTMRAAIARLEAAAPGQESAVAFDEVFGAAGALGSLLPKGPWSAYFDLLAGFSKYHFFETMGGLFKGEADKAWKAADGEKT